MAPSAAYALHVAVVALFRGDAAAATALGAAGSPLAGARVFDRPPPEGTPYPFVIVGGDDTEVGPLQPAFEDTGNDGRLRLDVWAERPGLEKSFYAAHVKRLLHGTDLVVSGHRVVSGETTLRSVRDPSGVGHGVVDYRAFTVATA